MTVRLDRLIGCVCGMGLLALGAWAGTLRIVSPVVEDGQILVPVAVQGDVADGVAALDFLLNYDPGVLEPVGVSAGSAAVAAGKQVQGSLTNPGQYVVVMLGMNQSAVRSGEVVNVTLRQVGQPDNGRSDLSISRTTLASLDAVEIPSEGSSATLSLKAADEDDGDTDGEEEGESEGDADEGDAGVPGVTTPSATDGLDAPTAGGPGVASVAVPKSPVTTARLTGGEEPKAAPGLDLSRLHAASRLAAERRAAIRSPGVAAPAHRDAVLAAGDEPLPVPSPPESAARDGEGRPADGREKPAAAGGPAAAGAVGAGPAPPPAAERRGPDAGTAGPQEPGPSRWAVVAGVGVGVLALCLFLFRRRLFS